MPFQLVLIPDKKYIKYFSAATRIYLQKCNGMSEEYIQKATKSDSDFAATFVNNNLLPDINFNGHSLINNNISILKKVINLYIFYIINPWLRNLNSYFTLNSCLCESVKLNKSADLDKYKYTGYGIGFPIDTNNILDINTYLTKGTQYKLKF